MARMIELNKNPAGRVYNLIFGLSEIADGLIRVLSLGYLHSRFAVEVSRLGAKRHIMKLKAAAKVMASSTTS